VNDSIEELKRAGLPKHVAIILDGNGRWAQQRNLSRTEGHFAGAQAAERLIRFAASDLGLRFLTLYAFSAENWRRPKQEVDALMGLLKQFAIEKLPDLKRGGIRLRIAGDVARVPQETREAVEYVTAETAAGEGLTLTIAINYGAQQEILRACKLMVQAVASGELSEAEVTPENFEANLYTAGIPDPDLIIRTSGEQRLSNFLLWQAAYAELAFPDTLWPDFTPEEFTKILGEFQKRDRRFGSVGGE